MPTLKQICIDIKNYINTRNQSQLYKNIKFANIPTKDLDVLFSYLSINLICQLYGGNFQQHVKHFNARIQEKNAADEIDESKLIPYEPPGIGDHQYSERVRQKVIHSLEGVIDQNAANVSHNQYVQAAKALLDIVEKTKIDAAEIMMAYESQLLVLAEHLVENFLPQLGQQIKKELRSAETEIVKRLTETMQPGDDHLRILSEEIDRVIRSFELKRYELLLAETMASNKQVSEAFDFSRDLIDNYKTTSEINIEDKDAAKLKEHIGQRK